MRSKIHNCEPTLDKLYKIKEQLYKDNDDPDCIRKIEAIEAQIQRHIAIGGNNDRHSGNEHNGYFIVR